MERLSLAQANEHSDRMLEDVARRTKVKVSHMAKRPMPAEWEEDADELAVSAKTSTTLPPDTVPPPPLVANQERIKTIVGELRTLCDEVHVYTTDEERALFRRAGARGTLQRAIAADPPSTLLASVILSAVLGLALGTALRYMSEKGFRGSPLPTREEKGRRSMSRMMSTFTS